MKGDTGKEETEAVVKEVVTLLQRVLGGNHEPYLVECRQGEELAGQSDMTAVDGVEGTSEKTNPPPPTPPKEGSG